MIKKRTAPSGSPQQLAVWDCLQRTSSHILVRARAGTGKTYTIVEGLKTLPGVNAAFVAFNKAIATELQARVPEGVVACTLHSLGNRAVSQAYGRLRLNQYKVRDIMDDLFGKKAFPFTVMVQTEKLIGLLKANLADYSTEAACKPFIDSIFESFDLDLNGQAGKIVPHLPTILSRCEAEVRTRGIDFDDMIWLPVVKDLPMTKYDLLMVDESQDLNICQQQLALKAGKRICLVGDDRQSIYGFRGADHTAMETMKSKLPGVVEFPLTATRRCPVNVVELAKTIVPDLEALPDAPQGTITVLPKDQLLETVNVSDMLLCRVNAPLVSTAYNLIRAGKRAMIQGRDIGQGLKSLVNKLSDDSGSIAKFIENLEAYELSEREKIVALCKFPEGKLSNLTDKCECLRFLAEVCSSTLEIQSQIDALFTDVTPSGERVPCVLLSSVHKSKGLEAQRVFILNPEKMPHPMAKTEADKVQEENILYVAMTRAKNTLFFVGGLPAHQGVATRFLQLTKGTNHVKPASVASTEAGEGTLPPMREETAQAAVPVPTVQPMPRKASTRKPAKAKAAPKAKAKRK